MEYAGRLLLLIAIGAAGAFFAVKIKFPTGIFLGPIIFVGTYQIIFGKIVEKPEWFRLVIQIAVGLVLGTKFTKDFFDNFKKIALSTLTACGILLGGALLLGIILKTYTGWDIKTSIISTALGGQTEMTILSESVGAQTEKVIILQLVRNQLALIVMLPLLRLFFKDKGNEVKN